MGSTKSYISKRPTKYLEHYQDKYQFSFHFFVAMSSGEDSDKDAKDWRKGPRTAYDVQRSKLEKLMKNPEKPVNVPQPRKEKDPNKAPDFVYNVMGSSAGAGSGEFHVYRQIRRKEFARQKVLDDMKTKDELNEAYHAKLEENEREAEERTAKKRAKRQKKKAKQKQNKKAKKCQPKNEDKVSKPVPSNSTSGASNNEHLSKSEFEQPAKKIELEDQSEKTRKLNETINKLEKDIQKRTQQLNHITNDKDEDSQKQAKIQKLNQIIKNLEKDIERKTEKLNQIINEDVQRNEFKVSRLVPSNSKSDASNNEHVDKSEVEQPTKEIELEYQSEMTRNLNDTIKKLEKDIQRKTQKINQIINESNNEFKVSKL